MLIAVLAVRKQALTLTNQVGDIGAQGKLVSLAFGNFAVSLNDFLDIKGQADTRSKNTH
ncbi:hypothetical protein [Geoalkalibacter halelectricus]|uniref:hypothetical protein n=1 Tax=Geoalkalibacter halelectricus TaxID=2847045 RepID=UPI003D22C941